MTKMIAQTDAESRQEESVAQAVEESRDVPRSRELTDGALFHLCPLPMALATYPEGRLLEINGALVREAGWPAEELVGRTTDELGWWLNPDQQRAFLQQLRDTGRVEGHQLWLVDASGDQRLVEIFAEPITFEGKPCLLVAGRDVSQALYDPLTTLPKRRLFERRSAEILAGVREEGGYAAVFFIDVDRLKSVNDSLGHQAGDELLAATARRLRGALASSDVLARIGGDEMVAVLRLDDPEQAERVAERLLDAVRLPLQVDGSELRPSVSIGVAVVEGRDCPEAEDILRRADVAMYRAKHRGGGALEMFDADLDTPQIQDFGLERELRRALERQDLELHYQPIVGLDRLSVWGAEALARWQHPRRGPVPPAQFVPLAETTGLIGELGRQVLRQACQDAACWLRDGVVQPGFVMSVNVSALQLENRRFAHEVAEVLAETGLSAANLQLEITERVALRQTAAAYELQRLGVSLAIDDFGQGYGSLAYLRSLPVDAFKMDASFTSNLTAAPLDYSLMRTMVFLADDLGVRAVAEGVETAEQLRCLREIGCRLGQGYLFGEPMSAREFTEMAAAARPALRVIQGEARSRRPSTAASRSDEENGLERNGVSLPTTPRAISTSSR